MKNWILFILILLSNIRVHACGWDGDYGIFASLYPTELPLFEEYRNFNYGPHAFEWNLNNASDEDQLVELWSKRYNHVPDKNDIYQLIFINEKIDWDNPTNEFHKFLIKKGDTDAINYIRFAKKCSQLNYLMEDPWERRESFSSPIRAELMTEAEKYLKYGKDHDLKQRYAFVAIRLAYYNNQPEEVIRLYESYVESSKEHNDYKWFSMSFRALVEENPALKNYFIAQVFSHVPGKRVYFQIFYSKSTPVTETLAYAKNKEEQENIWFLEGLKNPGYALEEMKELYQLNPSSKGLAFLLHRELNKIEDWIFTPLYSKSTPYLTFNESYTFDGYEDNVVNNILQNALETDRAYASEVAAFVKNSLKQNLFYKEFWKTNLAYLYILSGNNKSALSYLSTLPLSSDSIMQSHQQMLLVLGEYANSYSKSKTLSLQARNIILRNYEKNNYNFIYIIAKELDWAGNRIDGIILKSRIGSYFEELDSYYSPAEIEQILNKLQKKSDDPFENWVYISLRNNIDQLRDLQGVKYIREDNLKMALKMFEKVSPSYWQNSRFDYLDSNPFYTNAYQEHSKSYADTVRYSRIALIKQLIAYKNKADNPKEKNRDYYYFLVANCYLNMSFHGNSWLMQQYSWSANDWLYNRDGKEDYYTCSRAATYYLKAKSYARSKRFAALCLRMAGRCEKYKLMYENNGLENDELFDANPYYRQLEEEYPDDYDELISNCESFEPYFQERRKKL
jgi:hypothetical protein